MLRDLGSRGWGWPVVTGELVHYGPDHMGPSLGIPTLIGSSPHGVGMEFTNHV